MKRSKWHYAGPRARELLGPDPEKHLAGENRLVKSNAVREVRQAGDFYFKLDRRRTHSFRREFSHALALQKRGIPVVEHLACGITPAGPCLVTRSLDGSVTVEEFLAYSLPDDDFLNGLTDFLKLLIYRKVIHKDLHCGNILYVESSRSFALVDVRDAYPGAWYHLFPGRAYPMRKLLAELAGLLPEETVCHYLARLDVKEPRIFLNKVLERKAALIAGEWTRRCEQILSGYPKFTRKEGDMLFARDVREEDLENAVMIPADAGVFATAFYLDLVRIPHRKVLAWNAREQFLWAEPLTNDEPDSSRVAELRSRALQYGINSSCGDWAADASGLVKLSIWKGK